MNWPNFISLGRLIAVPIIIWCVLTQKNQMAFWLFIAAGISDILDGLLARLLKERTTVGAYLDPLADKALLMGLFITLAVRNFIPLWLVIVVVFRDVIIIAGSILLMLLQKPFSVKPLFISKMNTLVQILLVSVILAGSAIHYPYPNIFADTMIYSVAFTTICSGIAYLWLWVQIINKDLQ